MVSVNKIPVTRLFQGGSERIDYVKRDPDNRTLKELKDTISAYSDKIPVVEKLASKIKELPKQHMGIVADTIELSQYSQLFAADVNLNQEQDGRNLLETILNSMIMASKYNPAGLNLIESVINNTDMLTSKFALYITSYGLILNNKLATHMEETAKVIPEIAQDTLISHNIFDFSERIDFMKTIQSMVSEKVIPEKITSYYRDIMSFARYIPQSFKADRDMYMTSKTPMSQIKENLKILPQILGSRPKPSKTFNLVEFVTKNTNLV